MRKYLPVIGKVKLLSIKITNDVNGHWLRKIHMITQNYTLYCEIPFVKNQQGQVFCDVLWAKDLKLHFTYIKNFSICCPLLSIQNSTDIAAVEKIMGSDLAALEDISALPFSNVFDLNYCNGWVGFVKNLLPNFLKVRKTIQQTEIAHSGAAGWPFPLSFYLILLKLFYPFKWIMVIESSFFLMHKGERFSFRHFLSHHIYSFLVPICVKMSQARIFTHTEYWKLFCKSNKNILISPASWLDDSFFLTDAEVDQKKIGAKIQSVKMIFAGRLYEYKGIKVLFRAIEILQEKNIALRIDLMGSGDMEAACKEFAAQKHGSVNVSFIDTVPYGLPFFKLLQGYDVMLVPSLKEEQPRIIFDAYSQAMCVIGSDTSGITELCKHKENALICKLGSAEDLAEAIIYASQNKQELIEMGINGLSFVKSKTHQKMHIERELFLKAALQV